MGGRCSLPTPKPVLLYVQAAKRSVCAPWIKQFTAEPMDCEFGAQRSVSRPSGRPGGGGPDGQFVTCPNLSGVRQGCCLSPAVSMGVSKRMNAASRAQVFDFNRLPDDLLSRILGVFNVRERCERSGRGPAASLPCRPVAPQAPPPLPSPVRSLPLPACRQHAALVCRRWHRCAHAPEVYREVKVEIELDRRWTNALGLERQRCKLSAVFAWLARHGQHLRQLSLELRNHGWAEREMERLLAQRIAAAAAAMPQLQQLYLAWNDAAKIRWAGELPPSLQQLGLYVRFDDKLRICSSMGGLTQLTLLSLSASVIQIDQRVRLPSSIRTLAQYGNQGRGLPPQASCKPAAKWSFGSKAVSMPGSLFHCPLPTVPACPLLLLPLAGLRVQLSTLTRLDTLVANACNVDGLSASSATGQLSFLQLYSVQWRECIGDLTGLQHLVSLVRVGRVHCLQASCIATDRSLEAWPALQRCSALITLGSCFLLRCYCKHH